MNKKILTIKNVLIIITLSFGLISSLSKCNAYTFEDLGRFLDACIDNNITSTVCSSYNLQDFKTLYNHLKNANIDFSFADSFAFDYTNNQAHLYCGKISWGGCESSNYFQLEWQSGSKYYFFNNSVFSYNTSGWKTNLRCGIWQGANTSSMNFYNVVCQNRWDPNTHPIIPPFTFTPYGILTSR